jgi:hypothetical protein
MSNVKQAAARTPSGQRKPGGMGDRQGSVIDGLLLSGAKPMPS